MKTVSEYDRKTTCVACGRFRPSTEDLPILEGKCGQCFATGRRDEFTCCGGDLDNGSVRHRHNCVTLKTEWD